MASLIRSRTELLVLLAAVALACTARAEDERTDPRVRELVARGRRAYALGRVEQAISDYSEAYALQPLPALLFNLGQCQRERGDLPRARIFWARYLELAPEGKNAPVAKELLARTEAL